MEALTRNRSLKELEFRTNFLDYKGVKSIANFLVKNHALENLVLTDCRIDRDSMHIMLENIANFRGIKELHLYGLHTIGLYWRPEWIHLVTEDLRQTKNVSLEALYLPCCFNVYRSDLNDLLDLNLGGRKLLSSPIQASLAPLILDRINKVHLPGSNNQSQEQQAIRRDNMIHFLLHQRLLLEH
jgi:hypothetical protein